MLRPRPVPLPTSLVVKKGSKTRSRTSGGIPQPLSATDNLTYDPGTAPGHGSLVQNDVPRLDLEHAAIRHGIAPIQGQVEEGGLQQRRIDVAQPQSLVGPQLDLASASDRLANEPLEFANQLVCADQFWVQSLPPRKGEKLRRQLGSPISGTRARPRRTDGPCRYPPASSMSSRFPETTASRLLKSCATPPVSWPTDSIFWLC